MIILPAIDIIDGKCVRLYQGDYGKAEQVANSILDTALSFETNHAQWVHMVDLDGAKQGHPVNDAHILEAAQTLQIPIEVGGGIRTMEQISNYLENGVQRVILGTAAVENETLLKDALSRYGNRIAVGIDAKNGIVKTAGWLGDTALDYVSFAQKMYALGVETTIATDISKDGTLTGPNFDMYKQLQDSTGLKIIASGGMHAIKDIEVLAKMNLYGAIVGKAIYSGDISLQEAIEVGNNEN